VAATLNSWRWKQTAAKWYVIIDIAVAAAYVME